MVDAHGSGPCARKGVEVQVLSSASPRSHCGDFARPAGGSLVRGTASESRRRRPEGGRARSSRCSRRARDRLRVLGRALARGRRRTPPVRAHDARRRRSKPLSDRAAPTGSCGAREAVRVPSGGGGAASALCSDSSEAHHPAVPRLVRPVLADPDPSDRRGRDPHARRHRRRLGDRSARSTRFAEARASARAIAAELERLAPAPGAKLVPLLRDWNPAVRFWGATLLAAVPGSRRVDARRAHVGPRSERPRSRGRDARDAEREGRRRRPSSRDSTTPSGSSASTPPGRPATSSEPRRRRTITRLLADERWWVRTAAKDALRGMGTDAVPSLLSILAHDDPFARNGAAEVLQDIGFVDFLARDNPRSPLLERIYAAGGERYREAAEARASTALADGRGGAGRMTTVLTVVVLVCFAYLLLVEPRRRRVPRASARSRTPFASTTPTSNDYATLGVVTLHDPGERHRRGVRRGDRHRVDGRARCSRSTTRSSRSIVVNDGSSRRDARAAAGRPSTSSPYEVFVRHIFTTQPGARASTAAPSTRTSSSSTRRTAARRTRWNAALNVARYRYVCGVDADTVFDPKALLKVMRVAINDPARIVGVTSQITTARDPEKILAAPVGATARRRRAARPLPASRLPPRVPQQSARLVAARLHALLARRLPDLAARRPRGGRRLLARRSRARTSSSRSASTSASGAKAATTRSAASPTASA